MEKVYKCLQDSSTALRSRNIGKLGELLAEQVLARSGFSNIKNLNRTQANHQYADMYAERGEDKYVISVKARNKNRADGKLNSAYNLSGRGEHLNLAEKAEQIHDAKAVWIAISLEEKTFSAYFGLLSELQGKNKIPMRPTAVGGYECLARDEPHQSDYTSIKNVYQTVDVADRPNRSENAFTSMFPDMSRWVKDFGYIEVGYDDCNRSFVRALDIGGMVWEGERSYDSVDDAMQALDAGIGVWLKEQHRE